LHAYLNAILKMKLRHTVILYVHKAGSLCFALLFMQLKGHLRHILIYHVS